MNGLKLYIEVCASDISIQCTRESMRLLMRFRKYALSFSVCVFETVYMFICFYDKYSIIKLLFELLKHVRLIVIRGHFTVLLHV